MDGKGEYNKNTRKWSVLSKETLNRLSAPKTEHPKYVPDKPSIYWLDYITDPTPGEIIDPKQLQSYYKKFTTPRLMRLSKPKLTVTSQNLGESIKTKSSTGIPISALHYEPSDRIKALAEPRTSTTKSQCDFIPVTSSVRGTQSCSMYWPHRDSKNENKDGKNMKARSKR